MARERVLPPEYIARVRRSMDAAAREVGLVMEPKDRLINTRLALATAEFARERGAFEPVHRALFKGHWEGTAGGGRGRGAPPRRAAATSAGINAIPSHIVGRRYLLVGAQPVSVFRDVLRRIAAE